MPPAGTVCSSTTLVLPGYFLPPSSRRDNGMSGGDMVFFWDGSGFKVLSRTNLVEGSWFDVPGGNTPPANIVPTYLKAFFRLIEQ